MLSTIAKVSCIKNCDIGIYIYFFKRNTLCSISCIGRFQAIKTDVLLIFFFITVDKTDDVFKRIHNWNLTFRILSNQFLAFVY